MASQPPLAPQHIEEVMEAKSVPESERDEVRRFAEFLNRDKKQPLSAEMRAFVTGDDK